jgi:hypothetical protein
MVLTFGSRVLLSIHQYSMQSHLGYHDIICVLQIAVSEQQT